MKAVLFLAGGSVAFVLCSTMLISSLINAENMYESRLAAQLQPAVWKTAE